ncbi:DUF4174 domain-containing protein [Thalassococcus lentus]|uniref:DUF4174 domain-containing protein n=1 Tax=Thalassococcus lentus TaxID=1210524 RepID=A0ABT4XVB5_9RHOB|nr:DUF4174 domain-containing protein [Thalassococcus lentus]MDA7425889.1 DUF4174 domain-containing protein [Thalassococcus lentus]
MLSSLASAGISQTVEAPADESVVAVVEETAALPEADDASPGIILPAAETDLADWLWIRRPIVVFADSPADPRFIEQMELLNARLDVLLERDVVILTDTDPAQRSSVRRELRARGFMLVIMAKDGTIVARKPAPWDVREISRSIDKLPLRQQEIRDRRSGTR